mgnify:CR=1 FL=1
MPITQLTPMSEIDRYTEQQLERLKQVLIRNLMYSRGDSLETGHVQPILTKTARAT